MSYIVDFDKLLALKQALGNNVGAWIENLEDAYKKLETIWDSTKISGAGAESVKNYYKEAHGILLETLIELVCTHNDRFTLYHADYLENIDTSLHARIPEEELKREIEDLTKTKTKAVDIDGELSYALGDVKSFFSVSYDNVEFVEKSHKKAIDIAEKLDTSITELEDKHVNTAFETTSATITSATAVINSLLQKGRSFKENYVIQDLNTPEWSELFQNMDVLVEENEALEGDLTEAEELLEEYVSDLQEEAREREERAKKAQWIKTGIAVIGSVALIVVTAGGATPVACAAVGAAVGVTNAVTDQFAESYINTGSLTAGIDTSDFVQACVVGGVTGAISAYVGSASMGSVIKQPIKNALYSAAGSVLENAVEGAINTGWDMGEAHFDCMPGEDIKSIFLEDVGTAAKEIVVEGGEAFAGGLVSGKFGVDAGDKSALRKFGEETAENAAKSVTKNVLDTGCDIVGAAVTSESRKEFESVLQKELKEGVANTAKDFVAAEVESVVTGAVDSYQKDHKDQDKYLSATQSTLGDIVGKTGGTVAGAVTGQGVEVLTGERESISMQEVWEEDLKHGAGIVENATNAAAKNYAEADFKDKKLRNDLHKKADKDGRIEVVVFDNYVVTKEDYDAAMEVAGKGAYKDQTAQDILGLRKNTNMDPDKIKVETVSYKRLRKSDYPGRKDTNITRLDFTALKKRIYTPKTKK